MSVLDIQNGDCPYATCIRKAYFVYPRIGIATELFSVRLEKRSERVPKVTFPENSLVNPVLFVPFRCP